VQNGGEALDQRAADALRGRVRIAIAMLLLELGQAAELLVEVVIADLGTAFVVEAVVAFELAAEPVDLFLESASGTRLSPRIPFPAAGHRPA
jgi:hypothetical protein